MLDNKLELKTYMSIAHKLNTVVIAPNYPSAPEYQYQATMSSLDMVVDWFLENSDDLLIDKERVVVSGTSTGGHLAAAISQKRKVRNLESNDPEGFQFVGQLIMWPILDDRPSYKSCDIDGGNCGPDLALKATRAWLCNDFGGVNVSEWAFPMRAKDFKGLPPTFLHVAELDHDRDSLVQYAQNLLDEGIFTELIIWGGAQHGGGLIGPGVGERVRDTARAQLQEALTGRLVRKNLKEDVNFRG